MQCIVTGASGFLGPYVVREIGEILNVTKLSLREKPVSSIDLSNTDVIVHLAGLAHQMTTVDSNNYFEINRDLTIQLAQRAKASGVSHFVFVSTVKVYGDENIGEIDENTTPHPNDPYGKSKLEGEMGIRSLEDENFKVAIVRPPLIYGESVKGNLKSLMNVCLKLPILPLGNINNKRSMVYAGNVAALIDIIIRQKKSGTFIAGDRRIYSTSELVEMILMKMNKSSLLITIPGFLRRVLNYFKPDISDRLFGNYVVQNDETLKALNFIPPYSFEEGIEEMVNAYKSNLKN